MIRKSQLTEENKKLKRKLFIWENISISINSSVKEKENAAEKFLNEHPDYNLYEVSDTIKINRGTLYHHLYTRVEKPWYVEKMETLSKEVIEVFEESKRLYGAEKIVLALKRKGIITDKKMVLKIMRENKLEKATIVKKKKPTINSWKYKKFKEFDWVGSKEWQLYYTNLFPTPPPSKILRYKKKFYHNKIDPDFDINYQPPEEETTSNTTSNTTSYNTSSSSNYSSNNANTSNQDAFSTGQTFETYRAAQSLANPIRSEPLQMLETFLLFLYPFTNSPY